MWTAVFSRNRNLLQVFMRKSLKHEYHNQKKWPYFPKAECKETPSICAKEVIFQMVTFSTQQACPCQNKHEQNPFILTPIGPRFEHFFTVLSDKNASEFSK